MKQIIEWAFPVQFKNQIKMHIFSLLKLYLRIFSTDYCFENRFNI
jgi:hypothetical protein